MAVKIGHAAIDERGQISGGAAGDQTGGEVCTRNWYANSWTILLRPKSAEVAEKSAKACEAGCANNKIGYDQGQRNTLRTQAKAAGFDLSKITTACETDCSAFMSVCAEAAGINMDSAYSSSGNAPTTSTMKSKFTATGQYEALTDPKYLASDAYLRRGDILVKAGYHTIMVLSNGTQAEAQTENTSYVGKGIGKATALETMNVRSGSGTRYVSYGTISKGTIVEVLEALPSGWYKIVWTGCSVGYAYTSNTTGTYYSYASNVPIITDKKDLSGTIAITANTKTYRGYSLSPGTEIGTAYAGEQHQVTESASIDGTLMYRTREERYVPGTAAKFENGYDTRITVTAHCQTYGNLPAAANGCVAGAVGEAKRLEALTINSSADLEYRAHCQTYGWMGWKSNGRMAGTTGEAKRLEAIQVRRKDGGNIRYRVHMQSIGWGPWVRNGEIAGTTGEARRIEAIQIVFE